VQTMQKTTGNVSRTGSYRLDEIIMKNYNIYELGQFSVYGT